jgi:peptidoglycan/LPS O-acetylase OafA/YrhL
MSSGQKPPSTYIPSLDGLRAFSIALVFLSHAGLKGIVPGYFGVSVFFLLSGFLITTLLRLEFEEKRSISLSSFYIRRVYRIWPPFYFFLIIGTLVQIVTRVGGVEIDPRLFGMQVAHLANYAIVTDGFTPGRALGTGPYWSLAVEEHFYLIFPLLYIFMLKSGLSIRSQGSIILSLCFFALIWRCVLVFGLDASKYRLYVATDTRFDSILFGCWLAIAANPWLDLNPESNRRLKWVGVLIGSAVIIVSFFPRVFWWDQTFRYTLQSLGLIPIFISAIQYPNSWPWRLLNYNWIRYVGVLSYSAYLSHRMIIEWVERGIGGPEWATALISLVATGLVSHFVYILIEKPFARLRKRMHP